MNEKENHATIRTYLAAFVWLVVFTAIELVAVFSHLPHAALITLILGTAIGKAFIIALFFMHLKFERWVVWLLPGVPVVFALIFMAGIIPDIVYGLTHLF
jgi:cytochrome c oxidase subunit 4